MPESVRPRSTCRVCRSPLYPLLDLGVLALPDFPPRAVDPALVLRAPLDLRVCDHCALVQLAHTVAPDLLYTQYWYRSGINEAMQAELRSIVRAGLLETSVFPQDLVVDVGANDGYLLSLYPQQRAHWEATRIAFEPARNLAGPCSRSCEVFIPSYFPTGALTGLGPEALPGVEGKVKILTSIAMFYDVEDPTAFVKAVDHLLHDDGVWICQFQDLGQMIEACAFDNVCLPAGDRVLTPVGLRAIDDIQIGDPVLTHRGRYRPVREVFRREYTGDLIELTAYGFGHTLRVTPNHPVLVQCGGEWRYHPAEHLHLGDVVARPILTGATIPTAIPCWVGRGRHPEQLTMLAVKDLLTLFGYYLAEGSIGSNGDVVFYFGPAERGLAEDCQRRIHTLGFGAQIDPRPTSLAVQAHGPLARVLERECGRGAEGKHLSPLLLSLTVEESEELLRAYIAGDGYEYRAAYLRASTVSEQLALDIALLANRVGWKANINEQDRPATCVIEGRTVAQLPLWDILIHCEPHLKQKVWLENGYQCGRIREIHRVPYHGLVHNIDVEDDHTYVTPAMTVHNCHEHLTYWSLASFAWFLDRCGVDLQITHAERRPINGGSLRLIIRRRAFPVDESVAALREAETPAIGWQALERFGWQVQTVATQIRDTLAATTGAIDLYGASTKSGTLVQYARLAPLLRQAWERNPEKIGKQTAAGIPIVSETAGRADPPELLLAVIWQFRDHLLDREAAYLAAGGSILFPLPEVDLVRHARV